MKKLKDWWLSGGESKTWYISEANPTKVFKQRLENEEHIEQAHRTKDKAIASASQGKKQDIKECKLT